MKKRLLVYLAIIANTVSCTSFQEEDLPDRLSVSVTELSYSKAGENLQVKVSSGTKWDVTSSPEWVSLQSISSGHSPYEWTVNFSASANDEYNREGKIMIKAGSDTAEITVTQEGEKGRYVAVESVSVSPTELTLTEGENASLTYSISPANASIKDVSWKSSAPSIATVSSSGRVDAVAEGTAKITVTTNDGNKTATSTVTVKAKVIPVTGVSLDRTSLSLTEGETYSLVATVTPSNATNKSVTWSSSNTTVATVSSSGVVTAKAVGSATITVKTADGAKTATCAVTVKAKTVSVTGVSLNKTSLTMTVGDTQTLTATVTPSNATNKSVSWSSSNTSVATVSSSGVVTAKAVGSATITVTTNDGGKKATCSVTVQAQIIAVTGVSLNKMSLSMTVGDTQTLTATVTPSNASNKSVTWSSSNTSVATVSSSGVVTAKSAGTAKITVKTNDGGKTATCTVTVKAATVSVTGVTLDKTSLTMTIGDMQTLTATITPSNATNKTVTWSSSNTSVATVNQSGLISAVGVGNVEITVITKDGSYRATCMVTVSPQGGTTSKGYKVFIRHGAEFDYDDIPVSGTYGENGIGKEFVAPNTKYNYPGDSHQLCVYPASTEVQNLLKELGMTDEQFLYNYDLDTPLLIAKKTASGAFVEPGDLSDEGNYTNLEKLHLGDLTTIYGQGLTMNMMGPMSVLLDQALYLTLDPGVSIGGPHSVYVVFPAIDNTKYVDVVVKFVYLVTN